MTEHVVIWYESKDGKRFDSELECAEYEINLLYKESGVRLYDESDQLIDELYVESDDHRNSSYDLCSYVVIDRSKEKENSILKAALNEWYGWCLIEEAINGDGTKYKLNWTNIERIE